MYKNLLLLTLILSLPVSSEPQQLDYSVITDNDEIKILFNQCSRMTPSFRTGYRKLDPQTLAKVEALLPQKLTEVAKGKAIKLDDYYRQYVAFELLRRKLVYVNAFHKKDIKTWAGKDTTRLSRLSNWQTKAINVCGGKSSYWGALYDGQTGEIAEILFNTQTKPKK